MAINPVAYDFNYELDVDIVCALSAMTTELGRCRRGSGADTQGIAVEADQAHRAIAEALKGAGQGTVLLGSAAMMHPGFLDPARTGCRYRSGGRC